MLLYHAAVLQHLPDIPLCDMLQIFVSLIIMLLLVGVAAVSFVIVDRQTKAEWYEEFARPMRSLR